MERRDFLKRSVVVGGVGGLILFGTVQNRRNSEPPSENHSEPGDRETPAGLETPYLRSTPTEDAANVGSTPTEDTGSERSPPRFADEYETVVNAVEVGADPEGEDPINDVLEEYADDNTLLSFPEGEYRVRPMHLVGYTQFGIAGASDTRPTFFGDPGSFSGTGRFLVFDEVSNFRLDGVDFDFCRGDNGGKLTIRATETAIIRDVAVEASCSSHLQVLGVSIRNQEGTGLVRNFRAINRGLNEGLTAVYVPEEHAGELTFLNCELEGFSDNGLYASAPGLSDGRGGTVHAVGGAYGNNNVSSVRLGTEGSTARGVSVRVDESPGFDPVNARGIRLRNGQGQIIENCELVYTEDAPEAFGAIVFHQQNTGATVRSTDITVDRDGLRAIYSPYNATQRESSQVFEDVTMTGNAAGGYTAEFVGRSGVVFRDCTIRQTGEQRSGIRFSNKDGNKIVDCHIEVTEFPIVVDDGTAEIRNTTIKTPDGERFIEHATPQDEVVLP